MPTVQVNDINLYYEVHGTGTPLVLIGGLANDLSESEALIHPLAAQRQVIAFDNRGAGRSDKPDQSYSIEQMAGDAAGLLRELRIARADVLGISMGGRIALDLALAHPEQVNRLILVSTSARIQPRPWWFGLSKLLATSPLFQSKYPQPRYAFLRQLRASSAYDRTARLGEIHAPTLILHGRRDKIAPYALAQEMRAGIAGSRLVAFDGGHLFFLFRERRRFLDTAAQFLDG
jgi:pimeloyl-ACP methyl ester carboxylesterase